MELKKSIKADLEWKKPMFFQIGFFLALALVLLMFELFGSKESTKIEIANSGNVLTEDLMIQTQQEKQNLTPPPPTPIASNDIRIIDDNIRITTETEFDAEADEKTRTEDYQAVAPTQEDETKEDYIFVVVEEDPSFPGGEEARETFLNDNISYPKIAVENQISGKVIVNFVVEPDGSISNVKIGRSVHQSLDDEAVRVVKLMPKWKPGKQRGKSVRCHFSMPVNFILEE
jgi:periplasmic protein TonB